MKINTIESVSHELVIGLENGNFSIENVQPVEVPFTVQKDEFGFVYIWRCPSCGFQNAERSNGQRRCRCGTLVLIASEAGGDKV